ncbi:MAG: methylthioribulose 1-phosphate dehydratase [Bacteriovoracaceae bacterium]|nr:methylthioribulose 1-phosphate dehydratase [Bacteriovoracaceae bacterium]
MEKDLLVNLIRKLNDQGHNPATSGNYSLREDLESNIILVSQSGIDKSEFTKSNLLEVDLNSGKLIQKIDLEKNLKSSDETAVHLAIYQNTQAKCVLHSHLLEIVLLAELFPHSNQIEISGYELLKAFKGVKSHEEVVAIPCLENSQDMSLVSQSVRKLFRQLSPTTFGLILRKHGIYVWGSSVSEAKRHLEAFEYLAIFLLAQRNLYSSEFGFQGSG